MSFYSSSVYKSSGFVSYLFFLKASFSSSWFISNLSTVSYVYNSDCLLGEELFDWEISNI